MVVLANGEYPKARLPLDIITRHKTLVVCDGVADAYLAMSDKFDVIIGDGDSISKDVAEQYASRIIIDQDQETNDQTKAVRYLLNKGVKDISIIGAGGKREDHLLGNVSLLIDYLKLGVKARIYTNYGVFIPIQGDAVISAYLGQPVSIFNFGCMMLDAEGLEYSIRPFSSWWEGTLNKASETEIVIKADSYYLIYLAY